MNRAAKIGIALTLGVATSPIWGFEVLSRAFLPAQLPELPAKVDLAAFEMDALWVASGERLEPCRRVTPLWALNYFHFYKRGADPRCGLKAAARIARLWVAQERPAGARAGRLRPMAAEIATTVWLSRTATVDELKRALAAREFFGRQAFGLRAARTAYFGCSAAPLTPAQVALLVGLPVSPGHFDPIAHPALAAQRRQQVLRSLAAAGLISEAEEAKWTAEKAESSVVPAVATCP